MRKHALTPERERTHHVGGIEHRLHLRVCAREGGAHVASSARIPQGIAFGGRDAHSAWIHDVMGEKRSGEERGKTRREGIGD